MGAAYVDILRRGDPVKQIKEDFADLTSVIIGLTPKMTTATSAAQWQLRRIEKKDGVITTLFANHAKYNTVWDDRLTYCPAPDGNQGISGSVETNQVTAPFIQWQEFPTTNQEETITFPAGTKRFLIKNMGSRDIQMAFVELDSGIDGQYITLVSGESHFEEELGADQTVYARKVQGGGGDQLVHVLSWS